MASATISVHGLRKAYGGTEVVRGIDFEVAAGEVFGFLGPSGAGKSTTIEILEGYRERTHGEVSVLGADPARPTRPWRERVGLVLQECELDPLLTVTETLKLFSAFYSAPRPVSETSTSSAWTRSVTPGGNPLGRSAATPRRRRGARRAPRAGVPRRAHHRLRPLGAARGVDDDRGPQGGGTTVFLTTHYLDEAQHLADRVTILRQSEILAAGRPDELGQRGTGVSVVSFRLPDGVAPEDVAARAGTPAERSGALVSLEVDDAQETLWKLTSWAREDGLRLEELEVRRPTLEDVFLELTGADHE